jgi:hypothetical protein
MDFACLPIYYCLKKYAVFLTKTSRIFEWFNPAATFGPAFKTRWYRLLVLGAEILCSHFHLIDL